MSNDPLTPEECQELRAILVKEKRMAWLWIFIRNTAYWIGGVLIAVALIWDKFIGFAKWVVGR